MVSPLESEPINGTPRPEPDPSAFVKEQDQFVFEPPHTAHRKKKKRKHKANIRIAALNITSFLDMSFALLTFLILGASFGLGEGSLNAKLPRGEGGAGSATLDEVPSIPMVLVVSQGRTENDYVVTFEGMQGLPPATDFEQLTTELRRLRQDPEENPAGVFPSDHVMIIKPTKDVAWQGVIQAFNSAMRAKFRNVAIARSE